MTQHGSVTRFLDDLKSGDQSVANQAAAQIWSRYSEALLRQAILTMSLKLRRRVDGDDVIQDVFKSFFLRHAGGQFELNDRDELWGLLAAMTRKKVLKQVTRHTAGRRSIDREKNIGAPQDSDSLLDLTTDSMPSPEQVLTAAELLNNLLGELDTTGRVIVLRRLEGLTHEEIAIELGCVVRTVERKISAIRNVLVSLRNREE